MRLYLLELVVTTKRADQVIKQVIENKSIQEGKVIVTVTQLSYE